MSVEISAKPRPIIPYEHPDAAMYCLLFKQHIIRQWYKKCPYDIHDTRLQKLFQDSQVSLQYQCDYLVRYVAEAFDHYAVWGHTHAYYPGRPSQQNARTDALEGVSRVLPTLAVWLRNQPAGEGRMDDLKGGTLNITAIITEAFLAGTDPTHPGYWGKLHDYDQRICESADLALALWLCRETVWERLTSAQQQQITCWFNQVNGLQTVDNNWHLFPLTVQFVMRALNGSGDVSDEKYERIKEFHVGGGWFRDGAHGNYDYYNAWGFHYSLYWLDQINPEYDPQFIRSCMAEFVTTYRYLMTPQGIPFFGRSACYRLAVSAPLLAVASHSKDALHIGEAKRALETTLRYFIGNGAMRFGVPTQGLFADDERLVDNYSGPASSFWSLRALNIALYCASDINLWSCESRQLPVELQDFSFTIEPVNLFVMGTCETKEVVATFRSDYTQEQSPLTRGLTTPSRSARFKEWLTGRAERPKNNLLRKGVTSYSSKMTAFF
ncbi:DUF2264 domain-containing protein [Salmonella enterica subsp. diarizonae]|uniref:DUF2264 domain-containing protein n=9 Tax=Salmonella TaxID=590 RepID=A0A2I5HG34_SALDZ|nr:DUF2264 domain-containing protein [Salmonella enterica]AXC64937.1 DUF2264 domain-containing protein [Salmonella enterica subsp. diarizonae serovar 59:z10:-]EAA7932941.1 DUF2264 domain-containing protein [Salmonella enterica subsp. enterica serovar Redlands]EBE3718815.1 DUF2264 domain-containing protein [Salmonella enterica subsp. diarizonae serovar 42:l,v:1,5,7]EBH8033854.1 DUF2264 domain-containing protein [Salmonella bongori]EBH8351424.1 DUF2264 domain-containing protein [Salmonella enter